MGNLGSIAIFWLVPVVALAVALLWAAWMRRPERRPGMTDTMAEYRDFRDVLDRVATGGERDAEPPVS